MRKSEYQLVNRGRTDKPCWTVEKNEVYCYSSRRKSDAESFLRMCRMEERVARSDQKRLAAALKLVKNDYAMKYLCGVTYNHNLATR